MYYYIKFYFMTQIITGKGCQNLLRLYRKKLTEISFFYDLSHHGLHA